MSSPIKSFPITVEILLWDSEGYIFKVIGSTGEIYVVGYDYVDGWYCPCPDHMYRKHECKHIRACKELLMKNHVHVSSELFCEVTS